MDILWPDTCTLALSAHVYCYLVEHIRLITPEDCILYFQSTDQWRDAEVSRSSKRAISNKSSSESQLNRRICLTGDFWDLLRELFEDLESISQLEDTERLNIQSIKMYRILKIFFEMQCKGNISVALFSLQYQPKHYISCLLHLIVGPNSSHKLAFKHNQSPSDLLLKILENFYTSSDEAFRTMMITLSNEALPLRLGIYFKVPEQLAFQMITFHLFRSFDALEALPCLEKLIGETERALKQLRHRDYLIYLSFGLNLVNTKYISEKARTQLQSIKFALIEIDFSTYSTQELNSKLRPYLESAVKDLLSILEII